MACSFVFLFVLLLSQINCHSLVDCQSLFSSYSASYRTRDIHDVQNQLKSVQAPAGINRLPGAVIGIHGATKGAAFPVCGKRELFFSPEETKV